MCTVSETIIIKGRASFAKVEKAKRLLANGSAGISQVRSVMRYSYDEKGKKRSIWSKVLLMIEEKKRRKKPTCTVNFFNGSIGSIARVKLGSKLYLYLFVDVFFIMKRGS